MKRLSREEKDRKHRADARLERRRRKRFAERRARPRRNAGKRVWTDSLSYYRQLAALPPKRIPSRLIFPKVFSFIDEPEAAIAVIGRYVQLMATRPGRVDIDQRECEQIDLCAGAVLNALTRAAIQRKDAGRIHFHGYLPTHSDAAEIVAATGLPKELQVELPAAIDHFDYHGLRRGIFTGSRSTVSSQGDIEATELIIYLDRCLRKYGHELSEEGRDRLGELLAEVINNCEDHSPRAEWWISGYLRQPKKTQYGDCHLTIFNLGPSLAQTLQQLPQTAYLRRGIDALIREHEKKRHFRSRYFNHELALARLALQPRISCMNTAPEAVYDRGQGTVRMMEAFHRLGQVQGRGDRPVMALVSGRSYFRFDSTYQLEGRLTQGGEYQATIAFNPENSLRLPPDPKYARILPAPFPGTLISLRFFIDPDYLETVPDYASRAH